MAKQDQMDRLRGELEKVIDRIASDAAYRQEVLDNPRAALVAVGLELPGGEPEVAGYAACTKGTCTVTCGISCSHASPKTCARGTCQTTSDTVCPSRTTGR